MSLVIRLPDTQPTPGARLGSWPQAPHPAVAELAPQLQPLGRLSDCSAVFAVSGGLATATEVADRLRAAVQQPVSVLAHWIVDRQVIAFSCGAGLWLPLFQFDFAQGCVRHGVAPTIAELSGVMTDVELALWFVQPNGWLSEAAPAETLLTDVQAVLAAARADRFVVKG